MEIIGQVHLYLAFLAEKLDFKIKSTPPPTDLAKKHCNIAESGWDDCIHIISWNTWLCQLCFYLNLYTERRDHDLEIGWAESNWSKCPIFSNAVDSLSPRDVNNISLLRIHWFCFKRSAKTESTHWPWLPVSTLLTRGVSACWLLIRSSVLENIWQLTPRCCVTGCLTPPGSNN